MDAKIEIDATDDTWALIVTTDDGQIISRVTGFCSPHVTGLENLTKEDADAVVNEITRTRPAK